MFDFKRICDILQDKDFHIKYSKKSSLIASTRILGEHAVVRICKQSHGNLHVTFHVNPCAFGDKFEWECSKSIRFDRLGIFLTGLIEHARGEISINLIHKA